MTLPQAVLLDRDGTLNVLIEGDYVRTPQELVLLPGAAAAIARLNEAGVPVFLVTNQRGISRGLMTDHDLAAVHEHLKGLLGREGAHLDGIYACPHASGSCDCRKPRPGLAEQAATDHGLDLSKCLVIGDSDRDMGMAAAVGAEAIRVGPGYGLPEAIETLFSSDG